VSKHIKYQWRITKYNPNLRNNEGHYTKELEWTSSSDIGKNIYGDTFTFYMFNSVFLYTTWNIYFSFATPSIT